MKEKKPQVTVLVPNPKMDVIIARLAYQKGGHKMGMSQYLLSLVDDKIASMGGVDACLEALEREQAGIPATEFKRGNRKRLLSRV